VGQTTPAAPAAPKKPKYGGTTKKASKWWAPWTWGDKTKTWTPDPAAFKYGAGGPSEYWQQQAGAGNLGQMQFGQPWAESGQQMNEYLMQVAMGQTPSAAQAAGAHLTGQQQAAIASQTAAAQRGGYDPAAARGAQFAQAQAGQNIAGQVASQAIQERMAAAQAAQQGALGFYGQDIRQGMGMQQLALQQRMGMMGMGLQEKYRELMARMAYEDAQRSAYLGEKKEKGTVGKAFKGAGTALATYYGGPAAGKAASSAMS
jgi:hypothetical protein